MFKKELADVLKQTGLFLIFLAVAPIAFMALRIAPGQPYPALLLPTVQVGFLFWSFFLGASLFGRERGQRAMEYTLSLPYSRLGLLGRLAAPRILVLIAVWALTLLMPAGWTQIYGFLPPALFGTAYFLIFVIALSFAPLFENFLVLAFSTILAFFLVSLLPFLTVGLAYWSRGLSVGRPFLPAWREILSLSFTAFPIGALPFLPLLAFAFIAALLAAFRKFDARPSRAFRSRFILVFAPALILTGLAAFAVVDRSASASNWYGHYLTRDLHLLDYGYLSNTVIIRDGRSVRRVKLGSAGFWSPFEEAGSFYFSDIRGGINRLDVVTGAVEVIYRPVPAADSWGAIWIFGSTFCFFERGPHPGEAVLVGLEQQTKKMTRVTFTNEAFRQGMKSLIGANTAEGRRYWLCTTWFRNRNHLFRLSEEGVAEDVVLPGRMPPSRLSYDGGLLFDSAPDGLTVLKDTGTSFEILKKFPASEISLPYESYYGGRLDRPNPGFLVGKRGRNIVKLDLKTLTVENIGVWTDGQPGQSGQVAHLENGRFYLRTGARAPWSAEVYDLNDGPMRLLWSTPPARSNSKETEVGIFPSGILVKTGREFRAYAFPDMREIKFK